MNKLEILRRAKHDYINGFSSIHGYKIDSMCWAIGEYIPYSLIRFIRKNHIFLFKYCIAKKKFGANIDERGYWWDIEDMNIRIKYFDWLISMYSVNVFKRYIRLFKAILYAN